MSMTISIRIKPMKAGQVVGQVNHDFRRGPQPQYVDSQRTRLNSASDTAPTPSDLIQHARRKCARPPRRDWSPAWSGVITFGTDAQPIIQALPTTEQDELYRRIAQRLAENLGVDLHHVAVHRDESSPHAHFMVCGTSNQTGKSIRPKPQDLKRLQDIAGECCMHLGITRGIEKTVRIERGEDYSKTINRSVKQLHQDLPREIQALEKTRDNLAALFKKLPKAPRLEPVEIITKRRALMPPVTEIKKVITDAQRREWFEYSKSRFAEYFAARESEINAMREEVISTRYKITEKMREIEAIAEKMQKQALWLKRELSHESELSQARNIRDEALTIITPSR